MKEYGIAVMLSTTKGGRTEVEHFKSIASLYRHLRRKGCKISNSTLTGLDFDDEVTITTPDCEYVIEREASYGYKKEKRKG